MKNSNHDEQHYERMKTHVKNVYLEALQLSLVDPMTSSWFYTADDVIIIY